MGVVITPERGMAIQQPIGGYVMLGGSQLRWMNERQWSYTPERVLWRSAQESTPGGAMDIQQSTRSTLGATSNEQNQRYAHKHVLWLSAKKSTLTATLAIQQSTGGCAVLGSGQLSWMNGRQWGYAPKCVIRPLAFGLHRAWPRPYKNQSGVHWAQPRTGGIMGTHPSMSFGLWRRRVHRPRP